MKRFSPLALPLLLSVPGIGSVASTGSLDTTQWRYDTVTGAWTNKLYSDGKYISLFSLKCHSERKKVLL